MQDYAQAAAHLAALDPTAPLFDFRYIHDTDKSVPAIPRRGTLEQFWSEMCQWNSAGYGVFVAVSALDGQGRELANVQHVRAHTVDLDSVSATVSMQQAAAWSPSPAWYVQSSPGKFHVYWPVQPYRDNERFKGVQRKLLSLFGGDRNVVDATRVLRLPGTLNWKYGTPALVTCAALGGYGQRYTVEQLEAATQHVQVFDPTAGERFALGDPTQAAPSLAWLERAMTLTDPNNLSRDEWLTFSAGVKQAGWTLSDPDALYTMWANWCARYDQNDIGENAKLWRSVNDTAVGWQYVLRKAPALILDGLDKQGYVPRQPVQATPAAAPHTATGVPSAESVVAPPPLDCSGEVLTHLEQKEWFKDCFTITSMGKILTPDLRFTDSTRFNSKYGGKLFIITGEGKLTDEPWKAATRSTVWTIPKVDHVRFVPDFDFGTIIKDEFGRDGVNTYKPINIQRQKGDVSPFLRHLQFMIPDEQDRKYLLDFMAHVVKYPGFKIQWAPLIQSAEGGGKGWLIEVMETIIGLSYAYRPKAQDLVKSGSTFNGWMANKLLICVDEIKVDEKRDLVEILKPMITERRIEVQSKGIDQTMSDNYANWMFLSNFKDAIPVGKNGRRYAVFYSAFQSKADMLRMGLDDNYFAELFTWTRNRGGWQIVADYLLDYPIERGAVPGRAPTTTSMAEAMALSRGPIERAIADAVVDNMAGFRNGWVSVLAVHNLLSERSIRQTSDTVIEGILTGMGYSLIGRAVRAYGQESYHTRSMLYNVESGMVAEAFGRDQGYD